MRIRPMTRDDLVVVAHINTIAFEGDAAFNWIIPRAAEQPDVWRQRQTIRTRQRFVERGSVPLVAESEPHDEGWSGQPEIAGFAFWTRRGTDAHAQPWIQPTETLFNKIERKLLDLQFLYELKVYDRGITDMGRAMQFIAAVSFDHRLQPGEWYFATLAVDPAWRRRGVGERLTRWGMERAQAEGVPCALVATDQGEALYRRLGFAVGERRDCAGVMTGTYMYWEPRGLEGTWTPEIFKGREDQIGTL